MRNVVWGVLIALAACAMPASAQSVAYSESFDGVTAGTLPAGWSVDPATGAPATGWNVDDTPSVPNATVPPGTDPYTGGCNGGTILPLTTYNTAPNSLNFNNGVDQDNGGLYAGGATSPVYTLSTLLGATVSFHCLWEGLTCDESSLFYGTDLGSDQKFIEILDAAGTTVLLSVQLCMDTDGDLLAPFGKDPLLDVACTEMNTSHFHTLDISGIGATSFRVRFRVNQTAEPDPGLPIVPTNDLMFGGWWVDDVQVNCGLADVTAPTAPTLLLPLDGSCTVNPVTFDWTDSTDTGPCGPGAIVGYNLQIDTVNPPVLAPFFASSTSTYTASGPAGTFFWRIQAVDGGGNVSPFSAVFSFTNTAPLPPLSPDTLYVNNSIEGAQQGDSGFVDPVIDEQPHFSAIYRDPNCVDTALTYRMQVSQDPTFTVVDFDSGSVSLVTPTPKDTRCEDLTISVDLLRDTIYFWRVLFGDASGPGAFSLAQSFRIGNDFDFGVRTGSTHHGRKCWVATAAWGSADAAPVQALQQWRFGSMESAGVGQLASRFYHVGGATVSAACLNSGVTRAATLPMSWASRTALPVLAFGLAVVLLGAFRVGRTS